MRRNGVVDECFNTFLRKVLLEFVALLTSNGEKVVNVCALFSHSRELD